MYTMRRITDARELAALPEHSVAQISEQGDVRVKTHDADEWDMIMSSKEVLGEGGGAVWILDKHEGEW
jgi:hypothetical protein